MSKMRPESSVFDCLADVWGATSLGARTPVVTTMIVVFTMTTAFILGLTKYLYYAYFLKASYKGSHIKRDRAKILFIDHFYNLSTDDLAKDIVIPKRLKKIFQAIDPTDSSNIILYGDYNYQIRNKVELRKILDDSINGNVLHIDRFSGRFHSIRVFLACVSNLRYQFARGLQYRRIGLDRLAIMRSLSWDYFKSISDALIMNKLISTSKPLKVFYTVENQMWERSLNRICRMYQVETIGILPASIKDDDLAIKCLIDMRRCGKDVEGLPTRFICFDNSYANINPDLAILTPLYLRLPLGPFLDSIPSNMNHAQTSRRGVTDYRLLLLATKPCVDSIRGACRAIRESNPDISLVIAVKFHPSFKAPDLSGESITVIDRDVPTERLIGEYDAYVPVDNTGSILDYFFITSCKVACLTRQHADTGPLRDYFVDSLDETSLAQLKSRPHWSNSVCPLLIDRISAVAL